MGRVWRSYRTRAALRRYCSLTMPAHRYCWKCKMSIGFPADVPAPESSKTNVGSIAGLSVKLPMPMGRCQLHQPGRRSRNLKLRNIIDGESLRSRIPSSAEWPSRSCALCHE